MKLILLTSSKNKEKEHELLAQMLDMGLPTLHVRKPKLSTINLKNYLEQFSPEHRKKIVIHTHHDLMMTFALKGIHVSKRKRRQTYKFWFTKTKLRIRRGDYLLGTSCKSLSSVDETYKDFDYVMLSPVFTNPHGHRPSFNSGTLKRIIPTFPGKIIARGGATIDSIEKAKEIGFGGIAFHRHVWESPDPVAKMAEILDKFHELGITPE